MGHVKVDNSSVHTSLQMLTCCVTLQILMNVTIIYVNKDVLTVLATIGVIVLEDIVSVYIHTYTHRHT